MEERAAGGVQRLVSAIPGQADALRKGRRRALRNAHDVGEARVVAHVLFESILALRTEDVRRVPLHRGTELRPQLPLGPVDQAGKAGSLGQPEVAGVVTNVECLQYQAKQRTQSD